MSKTHKNPVLKLLKVKIFLSTSLAYRKTDRNDESRKKDRYEQMVTDNKPNSPKTHSNERSILHKENLTTHLQYAHLLHFSLQTPVASSLGFRVFSVLFS